MKIEPHSESASSFARHRAKRFDKPYKLGPNVKHYGLAALAPNESAFYSLSEYSPTELLKRRNAAHRFNRNFPIQFVVFKSRTHLEIARIA